MEDAEEAGEGALTPGMAIAAEGFEFEVDCAREIADAIFETGQGMTARQRLESSGALATASVYAGDCAEEFAEAWNAAAADRFESRIAPSIAAWREGIGKGGVEFPPSRYGASF